MGIGGGLIQSLANQGAFSPYVNQGLFNPYSVQQPINPYAPQGMGYGGQTNLPPSNQASTTSGSAAPSMPNMEGRYEIRKMAQGGMAAAQNVADKGRGEDSMLVHMTPGEVRGLEAIARAHGGSLTINPDTGLVEAGFLKNILPAIAGAGLMMIPGLQGVGAGWIGAGVGALEYARTGDIGKGLLAGLGAFGGANLAGAAGLGGAPAAGVGDAAGFVKPAGSELNVLASEVPKATVPASASTIGKNALMAAAPAVGEAMTPKPIPLPEEEKSSGRYLAGDFQGYVPATPNPYYRPRGLGYTGYAAEGGQVPDKLQFMPNGGLSNIEGMRDGYGAPQTMDGNIPQFNAGGTPKGLKLGEGIMRDDSATTAAMDAFEAGKYKTKKRFADAKVPYTEPRKARMAGLGDIETGVAKAGGGSIGGYSDGGRMLKGPGDGMSDSIPATISGKQPARLADGEFVVPADVVSHLGNGSTDAGARKLYAMMDKIRQARTGKKKQAPAVKAEKYMPKA